ILAQRIEAYLAVASIERMPVEDHDAAAPLARQAVQATEKIDLLGRVHLQAEAPELPERGSLAEHERARGPPADPADRVPQEDEDPHRRAAGVESHRASARDATLSSDRLRGLSEQLRARPRVRVDEHQPVAARPCGAGVARSGDLVHRLE